MTLLIFGVDMKTENGYYSLELIILFNILLNFTLSNNAFKIKLNFKDLIFTV
jgi:hypothetical protein